MSEEVYIGRAIKLEPDSIYVIECERHLTRDQVNDVNAYLAQNCGEDNIRFVILHAGLTIAKEVIAHD